MTIARILVPSSVLLACLAAAEPARPEETTARLGWDEVRAVMDHGDFLPKIHVQRNSGRDRIKARLIAATEGGLRLALQNRETFVGRGEIRSIQFVPRKAGGRKNRNVAVAVAIPAAFGATLGAWAAICSTNTCSESGGGTGALSVPVGIAVPYLIYRRALKADRGSLSIVLEGGLP